MSYIVDMGKMPEVEESPNTLAYISLVMLAALFEVDFAATTTGLVLSSDGQILATIVLDSPVWADLLVAILATTNNEIDRSMGEIEWNSQN